MNYQYILSNKVSLLSLDARLYAGPLSCAVPWIYDVTVIKVDLHLNIRQNHLHTHLLQHTCNFMLLWLPSLAYVSACRV